ncbi:MAG: dihydrolipoamide acetyltransferase family protein, partial [Blastocatellia bacterium]
AEAPAPAGAPAPAAAAAPTPPPPPVAPPVAPAVSQQEAAEPKEVRSSPLVRNIAREHGVDLHAVTGTGIGGRVTKEDILQYIDQRTAAPSPAPAPVAAPAPVVAPAPAPAPPPVPVVPAYTAGERVSIEPMSTMRRRIAENMLASRRTSAHVTTFFEVDFTNVARLREKVKKSFEERNGTKLTFMPFIIKAVVDALKAFPIVNASADQENVIYKQDINVGMAVALDWGLIVPVIKQADALSLVGLARSSQDLATRARAKQLKPDEVAGGTFTITNFGLFGGFTAAPIINQPQLAILGVGGIHKRPWVVETPEGDAIAIRHISMLSLSFDHRIIDGAVGDQFLAHIRQTIETTDFSTLV